VLGWTGNTRTGASEAQVAKEGLICFHLDIGIEQRGWIVVEEYDVFARLNQPHRTYSSRSAEDLVTLPKDTKPKSPSDAAMTIRLLQESTGLPEGVRLDFRIRY